MTALTAEGRSLKKFLDMHFQNRYSLWYLSSNPLYVAPFNPISGRLLATPISGKGGGGCLGPPLISPVLTGRFLKFKRHSFRLNMIYISKKKKFQKFVEGGY